MPKEETSKLTEKPYLVVVAYGMHLRIKAASAKEAGDAGLDFLDKHIHKDDAPILLRIEPEEL